MGPNELSQFAQAFQHGQALTDSGRHADAVAAFNAALKLKTDDAGALIGLGLALFNSGDIAAADRTLRRCIAVHPKAMGAYLVLGTMLGQSARFTEAEAVMRAAVVIAPTHGPAWQLLGNSLHRQGRFADAEAAYRQALALTPNEASLWDQIGDTLIKRNDLDGAEAALMRARTLDPQASAPLTNLGRIQEIRGNLNDAIVLHTKAITRDPHNAFAFVNRGNARRFQNDFDGALADYNAALALAPDMPEARGCRGFTLLALGRLAEGWPDYGARIAGEPGAFAPTDATGWQGQSLAGKRVVVWTEYGLGDEILAASLMPEIASMTSHCTLLCEPRLVGLFGRSFPGVAVRPRGSAVEASFDFKFALADAARWLRPDFTAFPRHAGYLMPDAARVRDIKARLAGARNVGLAWRSASGSTGPFKSIALADWLPILRVPGLTFHNLQYGDVGAEIDAARSRLGIDIQHDRSIDSSRDLDGFAAQVAAMDLVISTSNTTVHFAGGLGRPVWTLVPDGHGGHWYWFRDRADSPWYPSMRLFRQPAPGTWAPAIDRIAEDLRHWVS